MDITLLPLIDTYLPLEFHINEHGVIVNYLKYEVTYKSSVLRFSLFSKNGIWGGTISLLMFSTWGVGHPLTLEDAKFTSLEDCMDYLWTTAENLCSRDEKGLQFVQKERIKWNKIPDSEKINQLKLNIDSYGTM